MFTATKLGPSANGMMECNENQKPLFHAYYSTEKFNTVKKRPNGQQLHLSVTCNSNNIMHKIMTKYNTHLTQCHALQTAYLSIL